jgi:hypothetical protein
MTAEHHWTASDGTRLFYRVDDFTDPWTEPQTVVLLHPAQHPAQHHVLLLHILHQAALT